MVAAQEIQQGRPEGSVSKGKYKGKYKGEIQGEIQRRNTSEGASPRNTKKRRSRFCFKGQDVTSNKWLSL